MTHSRLEAPSLFEKCAKHSLPCLKRTMVNANGNRKQNNGENQGNHMKNSREHVFRNRLGKTIGNPVMAPGKHTTPHNSTKRQIPDLKTDPNWIQKCPTIMPLHSVTPPRILKLEAGIFNAHQQLQSSNSNRHPFQGFLPSAEHLTDQTITAHATPEGQCREVMFQGKFGLQLEAALCSEGMVRTTPLPPLGSRDQYINARQLCWRVKSQ